MFLNSKWLGNFTLNFLIILVFHFTSPMDVHAANSPIISSVEVGVGGYFKFGKWTPVTVHVNSEKLNTEKQNVQLKLMATDSNGNRVIYLGDSGTLNDSKELVLKGSFQTGRSEDTLKIILEDKEAHEIIDSTLLLLNESQNQFPIKPLRQSTFLVAGNGAPAGFSQLGETDEEEQKQTDHSLQANFVSLEKSIQIPDSIKGLNGVDAFVLSGDYHISKKTNHALEQWVKAGGHLIVAVGKKSQQYKESLLASWVPFKIASSNPLRELTELEIFSGKRRLISFNRQVNASQIKEGEGKVLVPCRNGTLIAQTFYGFGKITFIGLDIHKAPFLKWSPMKSVVRKILFGTRRKKDEAIVNNNQLAQLGISDLATQIRNYMEDYKSVNRLSNWSVLGIVLAYLLVIGPLDYFVVHRILKRPHLTWLTLPLLIAGAVFISMNNAQAMNGSDFKLRSLDIYDIDVAGKHSRTLSYFNLYSSETRRYKVQSSPNASFTSGTKSNSMPTLIWSGSPEEGVGGIYRMAGVDAGLPSYNMGENNNQITNLPVQIWSTANLQATHNAETSDIIKNELESSNIGRLNGSITHSFSKPLEDWIVFYQNKVFFSDQTSEDDSLTEINPNVPFNFGQKGIKQTQLKRYLTGSILKVTKSVTKLGNEYRSEQSSYDVYSKDPYQIIQAISFYKKAGGETYYHLKHNALRNYDLSEFLDYDKAILIARIKKPVTNFELNGTIQEASKHEGFVRIILPVKKVKTKSRLIKIENSLKKKKKKRKVKTLIKVK